MGKNSTQEAPKRIFDGIWIPKKIWLYFKLSAAKRCLLAEIRSLTDETDGCTAENPYFAQHIGVDKATISRWISEFESEGWIRITHRFCTVKNQDRRVLWFVRYPTDNISENERSKKMHEEFIPRREVAHFNSPLDLRSIAPLIENQHPLDLRSIAPLIYDHIYNTIIDNTNDNTNEVTVGDFITSLINQFSELLKDSQIEGEVEPEPEENENAPKWHELFKRDKKYIDSYTQIIDFFNSYTKSKIQYNTKVRIKNILSILRAGHTVDDFEKVIKYKTDYFLQKGFIENINLETYASSLAKFQLNLEKANTVHKEKDNTEKAKAPVFADQPAFDIMNLPD